MSKCKSIPNKKEVRLQLHLESDLCRLLLLQRVASVWMSPTFGKKCPAKNNWGVSSHRAPWWDVCSTCRRSQAQPPTPKMYVWFLLHTYLSSHDTAVNRIHNSLKSAIYVPVPKHSDLYSVDLHQEANGFHEDSHRRLGSNMVGRREKGWWILAFRCFWK